MQKIRQVYFRTNHPSFDCEVSHNLCHTFQEMADSAGLLDSDIYKVQDTWTGQKELHATNHADKASQRDIEFSCMVMPTKSQSIMGLKGIHYPEALHWWGGHSYCPWCAKEGQNEGTIINHSEQYTITWAWYVPFCMDFFAMSVDTMRKHMPFCKAMAPMDRDQEE